MFPATSHDVKYQISQKIVMIKKLKAFRVNENANTKNQLAWTITAATKN